MNKNIIESITALGIGVTSLCNLECPIVTLGN